MTLLNELRAFRAKYAQYRQLSSEITNGYSDLAINFNAQKTCQAAVKQRVQEKLKEDAEYPRYQALRQRADGINAKQKALDKELAQLEVTLRRYRSLEENIKRESDALSRRQGELEEQKTQLATAEARMRPPQSRLVSEIFSKRVIVALVVFVISALAANSAAPLSFMPDFFDIVGGAGSLSYINFWAIPVISLILAIVWIVGNARMAKTGQAMALKRFDEALEGLQQEAAQAKANIEKCERDIALGRQKIGALASELNSNAKDAAACKARASQIKAEYAALERESKGLKEHMESMEARYLEEARNELEPLAVAQLKLERTKLEVQRDDLEAALTSADLLPRSDWPQIDAVIQLVESKRATTITEALNLLDRQQAEDEARAERDRIERENRENLARLEQQRQSDLQKYEESMLDMQQQLSDAYDSYEEQLREMEQGYNDMVADYEDTLNEMLARQRVAG